jgi:hypothetical protein
MTGIGSEQRDNQGARIPRTARGNERARDQKRRPQPLLRNRHQSGRRLAPSPAIQRAKLGDAAGPFGACATRPIFHRSKTAIAASPRSATSLQAAGDRRANEMTRYEVRFCVVSGASGRCSHSHAARDRTGGSTYLARERRTRNLFAFQTPECCKDVLDRQEAYVEGYRSRPGRLSRTCSTTRTGDRSDIHGIDRDLFRKMAGACENRTHQAVFEPPSWF